MNYSNYKKITLKSATSSLVIAAIFAVISIFAGCSENSNITGQANTSSSTETGYQKTGQKDSTHIKLELNLSFKSGSISTSKLMESNLGNRFNNIVKVETEVKPGESLDLGNLQPTGIFGLYLTSDGTFSVENSSGLSFRSKSVLMEKCEFIDLKITNNEQYKIKITGFVAGE